MVFFFFFPPLAKKYIRRFIRFSSALPLVTQILAPRKGKEICSEHILKLGAGREEKLFSEGGMLSPGESLAPGPPGFPGRRFFGFCFLDQDWLRTRSWERKQEGSVFWGRWRRGVVRPVKGLGSRPLGVGC